MLKTYEPYPWINCIDSYKYPHEKKYDNGKEWLECPNCGLKPKIWTFDNGESTACGCWESKYDHFSIHAESINSWAKRHNGSVLHLDSDALRKNWNHWCKTGEILFEHAGKRTDGRW